MYIWRDECNKCDYTFTYALGLEDIRNGIIRTPYDPYSTFKDDPLRILRLIRFACRFQFTIINQISQVLLELFHPTTSPYTVMNLLNAKIAKERITDEVNKMLTYDRSSCVGNNTNIYSPERAMSLLYMYNLLDKTIYNIPNDIVYIPNTTTTSTTDGRNSHTLDTDSDNRGNSNSKRNKKNRVHAGVTTATTTATTGSPRIEMGVHNPIHGNTVPDNTAPGWVPVSAADQLVVKEMGLVHLYMCRILESYILTRSNDCNSSNSNNSNVLMDYMQSGIFQHPQLGRYIRYAALAWWGRDKYVPTHSNIQSNSNSNVLKYISLTEYMYSVSIYMIVCDCVCVYNLYIFIHSTP